MQKNSLTNNRWFGCAFGVGAGALLLAYSGIAYQKQHTYIATTATVSDVWSRWDSESNQDQYTPTLEFEVDGEVYHTSLSESTKRYEIGDTVSIQYDPQNPTKTIDPNPIGPWLLGALGLIALAAGVAAGVQAARGQSEVV